MTGSDDQFFNDTATTEIYTSSIPFLERDRGSVDNGDE